MKILKGTHRALSLPQLISPLDGLSFKVKFNHTARYETNSAENQIDWNKLFGFTIGTLPTFKRGLKLPIHFNSVRFAWRYNDHLNCIEVCPYFYKDGGVYYYGKDLYIPFVEIEINDVYTFRIRMTTRGVVHFDVFSGNENILNYWIQYPVTELGWICWPYFGGDEPAPHTIDVDFEYA